jgi:nucleoside-diphosphate-sugar epimerase
MGLKKVLVAGATGNVGFTAAKHFSHLPEWEVVSISRRSPQGLHGTEHLSIDLSDREQCAEVFSQMRDVTHVIYAALYEKPGLIPGWSEHDQMETNLAMLRNLFDPLEEAATQLEHVTLMQGTKAYGVHVAPMEVPGKERNPRHQHENFYWMQEDYLREKQENGRGWDWTILRPQIVFGEALGSNMNPIPALGVYAALQRHAGLPLDFPGGADFLAEGVDADLLARAMQWAATTPGARNEYFNITNGDLFVMRNVWPTLAEAFGMEVGDDKPMSLAEQMPKWQDSWEEVVRRFDLRAPVSLEEFVGQSFIYTDFILGVGFEEPMPPMLVSTIKVRKAGFQDCVDTEDMFRKWIAYFQQERLLPPLDW